MKRQWQWLVFIWWLTILITGCSGDGDGGGTFTPPAPAALIVSAGDSQNALNWTQVSGATAYKIYRGTATGVTKASPTNFTSTINSYTDTGLNNGTTYFYIVSAINSAGEGVASAEKSATPQVSPPPFATTGVTAVAGVSLATISWTASTGAASYNIYYGTAAGVTKSSPTKVTGIIGTSQNVTGLNNGTKYYFVVTAVNGILESPESLEVSATPAAIPPPAAPTNLVATAGNSKADLAWTASAGAASYNVYMATSSPVVPGAGTLVASGISGTSRSITSLNPGTTYYFVVTAVSANGESGKSNEVSAIPTAPSRGPFSQVDLVGTWNFIHLEAGPGLNTGNFGWIFGTATVDASGNITLSNLISNSGSVTDPGALKWTMNADGTIIESGVAAFGPATHLIMSANKGIVVGTSTSDITDRMIRIIVKQNSAANFTAADLASKSYVFNQLATGAANVWEYGTGSTDSLRTSTINTLINPGGPVAGFTPIQGILSVDANGLVTNNLDPSYHGIMTPDKKVVFYVNTLGVSTFKGGVASITGQSFTLADLAGTWYAHGLVSNPVTPEWEHDTITFNSSGAGIASDITDSTGTFPNTFFDATLGSTGTFGVVGAPDVNGFMSYNKDLLVFTSTLTPGSEHEMYVIVK